MKALTVTKSCISRTKLRTKLLIPGLPKRGRSSRRRGWSCLSRTRRFRRHTLWRHNRRRWRRRRRRTRAPFEADKDSRFQARRSKNFEPLPRVEPTTSRLEPVWTLALNQYRLQAEKIWIKTKSTKGQTQAFESTSVFEMWSLNVTWFCGEVFYFAASHCNLFKSLVNW